MTKDKLKEEIGLYKLLMTITSAISSSLIGWLFNNSDKIVSVTLVFVFGVMAVFLSATVFFLIQTNIKIEELDIYE